MVLKDVKSQKYLKIEYCMCLIWMYISKVSVFSPEISDSIGAFSRSRRTRRWCAMLHNFLHMSGTVLVPVHVKHIIALQIYWTVTNMCSMSHDDTLILKTNHSYCNTISIMFSISLLKYNILKIFKVHCTTTTPSFSNLFIVIYIFLLNKIPPPFQLSPSFHPSYIFYHLFSQLLNSTLCVNTVLELSLFPIFFPMKPKYFCNRSD